MSGNVNSTVNYNSALAVLKRLWQDGILELTVCNNALIGIAKELGVLNPVLL